MAESIVLSDVRVEWPDGSLLFESLNLVIGGGRTGLVGRNGSGKTTLLRLIAGELRPACGSVSVTGTLGYLPQDLVLDSTLRVEEVLGVAGTRAALAEIESGVVTEANLAAVGDRWDAEEQARATLDRLGLGHVELTRRVRDVSGGEAVLLGLAAQLLARPGVLLLDEPTNNLDVDARVRLYEAVTSWPGAMVIVSHDRELLDLVDQVVEVRSGATRWYGGNLTAYEEAVAVEQEAAERMVRVAGSDVRRQQRELIEARTKLARRERFGAKAYENARAQRAVMKLRKRAAQVSAGKHRIMHEEKLEEAREQLAEAEQAVRVDEEIRVDLPGTALPAGRTALSLTGVRLRHAAPDAPPVSLDVRGPERVALVGRNGSGKTTLLATIAGELAPVAGTVRRGVPLRYLPQRLDLLDDRLTVAGNVARLAPEATGQQIRARLARFLFRGSRADAAVTTLSGGERFRATVAALLLAEPAPQLLLLDEPTNNLDLASVRQLTGALASYRGALIVASHDLPFLRELGITRWLRLDGGLTEADPM